MAMGKPASAWQGREVLAQTVGEFADPAKQWELVVQCAGSCAGRRRFVADLVPDLSPTLTWAEALAQFQCQCGAQADIVGLAGPPVTPFATVTWLLLRFGSGE